MIEFALSFVTDFAATAKSAIGFITVQLSNADRQLIKSRARKNARRLGISEIEWNRLRMDSGLRREILMAYDCEGERARIEKEKTDDQ